MRVVLVGYGGIAAVHAKALQMLGQEIVAVVGPNKGRARAFAEARNVKHSGTDLEGMLDTVDCDSIHVTSPPANHKEAILAALNRGLHVISEKPLTLTGEDARRLLTNANQKGVVHAVCFNQRYQPVVKMIRDEIAGEAFGQPRIISGSYKQSFHLLPAHYGWRYDENSAGPLRAVSEIGSHWLDLATYTLGQKIVSVSADFLTARPNRLVVDGMMYSVGEEATADLVVRSEDAAVLSLRFASGTLGQVLLSEISPGYHNQLELEVSGDEKTLAWTNDRADILIENQGRSERKEAKYRSREFDETFFTLFKDVYRVIEIGGSGQFATFADAAANIAVTEAAAKSAVSGSMHVTVE